MLYQLYELSHAAVAPWRRAAVAGREILQNPANPFSSTIGARATAAAFEMFANATRRYAKPEFGLHETIVDGETVPVSEEVVWSAPFCDLLADNPLEGGRLPPDPLITLQMREGRA